MLVKNRTMVVIILYLSLSIISGSLYSEGYLNLNSMSQVTERYYCNNSKFLSALNINKNRCINVIKKHSKECFNIINPIVPDVDIDNKRKSFLIGKSIGNIYVLCIKSYVYEEVYGIPNL